MTRAAHGAQGKYYLDPKARMHVVQIGRSQTLFSVQHVLLTSIFGVERVQLQEVVCKVDEGQVKSPCICQIWKKHKKLA